MQVRNLCDPERIKLEMDAREELGRLRKSLAETYEASSYTAFLFMKMIVAKNIMMFFYSADRRSDNI